MKYAIYFTWKDGTKDTFNVKSVFPNSSFDAKGFKFIGKTREKYTKK